MSLVHRDFLVPKDLLAQLELKEKREPEASVESPENLELVVKLVSPV